LIIICTDLQQNGRTALQLAAYKGHNTIAHYLEEVALAALVKVLESDILPFYKGVRGIIIKYLL